MAVNGLYDRFIYMLYDVDTVFTGILIGIGRRTRQCGYLVRDRIFDYLLCSRCDGSDLGAYGRYEGEKINGHSGRYFTSCIPFLENDDATRALMGFANGFMPAAMTMVSLSVPKERTGTALGIFQTGLIVGNVIGPLLGGLIEAVVGMRPVFFIAGGVLFIASAVVFFFVKEPHMGDAQPVKTTSFREDWNFVKGRKVLTDLLWLYFIMQAAILMLQPILALYVGQLQGTMEGAALLAGTILSVGGLAGTITTNIWAAFGQRKGYFKAVFYALCGTGIFLFLQSMPFGITWFGSLQILVGCFIVGVNPLLSAALAHYTEPAFRGRVFGMATTANQFGCMVGPLFASGVTTFFGIQYVFLVTGVLLMFVAYQVYQRRVKAADAF